VAVWWTVRLLIARSQGQILAAAALPPRSAQLSISPGLFNEYSLCWWVMDVSPIGTL